MKIELTKGHIVIIDDQDYDLIKDYSWYAHCSKINEVYAATRAKQTESFKSGKFLLMHRLLMNAQKGQIVDHIDGNRLNNSRSNLRIVTQQQNMMNMHNKKKNTTSKYKGVYFFKSRNKWVASINKKPYRKNLGYFDTEQEAAVAYNSAAKILFGEFALLNDVN